MVVCLCWCGFAEVEWGDREHGLVARAGEVREALGQLATTRGQLVAAVSRLDEQMEGLAGAVVHYAAGLQEQTGLAIAAALQRGRTAGAASAPQKANTESRPRSRIFSSCDFAENQSRIREKKVQFSNS